MRELLRQTLETIKVARPGFWPTQLWFFVLPLGQLYMFDKPSFWVGCTYVCFPLGLLLYGWNDLNDYETDARNPRKGSWLFGGRPDAQLRRVLPWIIAAVQLPFAVVFWLWMGPVHTVAFFGLVVLANALYNARRFGTKHWPVVDLLNQVGYLIIFLLSSWLCNVEQLHWPALVFSGLFAMQSHLFGQIMDMDADIEAGRKTTAIVIGTIPAKLLLAAMMIAETTIAARHFRGWAAAAFTGCGAAFFVADAIAGPKRYPLWFVKMFFIGWNVVVLATMHFVWREGVFLAG